MDIIKEIDRELINSLRLENEVLKAGYLKADLYEVEEIAKRYGAEYIGETGCFIADNGERLTDLLKSKAQRLGVQYVQSTGETEAQKTLKQQYRRFFDPTAKGYSEDPNSESYGKRVECHQKDSTVALSLINEFQQARANRGKLPTF
jgi:hypothetical protein